MNLIASTLQPEAAVYRHEIPAGEPFLCEVKAGQTVRLLDLEGNQAVDFLLYATADDAERYSAQDTVAAQGNLFLRQGTVLRSNEGRAMMTIAATSVEYHDTIGGACSCESNTLRYGHHTKSQHACVDNFLEANLTQGRGKRDVVSNINFFMNVPVEEDGTLGIVDGISAPGLTVDLRAEMDVIVVVSNCPQINNPCNGFNPTPVDVLIWALIWINVVGLGPFAGVLAILTSDFGAFGKLFSEAIEAADKKPVDGVLSTGGSDLQGFRFGVLPQVLPVLLSQVLYYFESNVRSATIIGIVGAGGIGLYLANEIAQAEWPQVAFLILMILVTVSTIDWLSGKIRFAVIGTQGRTA